MYSELLAGQPRLQLLADVAVEGRLTVRPPGVGGLHVHRTLLATVQLVAAPIDQLPGLVAHHNVQCAVIAVPGHEASRVTDVRRQLDALRVVPGTVIFRDVFV